MRLSVAVAVSCVFLTSLSAADLAVAAIKKQTNISPQGLGPALQTLAKDRELQVLYRTEVVGDRHTSGAVGEFTPQEALQQLLRGTGLTFRYLDEGTVTIERAPSATQSSSPLPSGARGPWSRLRLAQAEDAQKGNPGSSAADSPTLVGLEEIIVTAQKRVERLQDVPISISVLRGAELDRSRSQGLTELLRGVPGIAAPVTALGTPTISIRGVTTAGLAFAGSTTASYYIDSVPYGFVRSALMPDTDLYDLDRIEVLRGPQGTLFGTNAQSGVVRILTHDPVLNAFEWKGRGLVSSTEDGGGNYRTDVAVNLPLVEDKLAARASVGYQDRSGWIDKPGTPDADAADISNLRLKVKGKLSDNFSLVGSSWFARSRVDSQSIGNDEGSNTVPGLDPVRTDAEVYGLRALYDAGAVEITSATSYFDYDIVSDLDFGALGPAFNGIVQRVNFGSKVFSEEITFSSTGEGSWRWSSGASYRDVSDRFIQQRAGTFLADYEDSSESWAVFGEVTRAFFDGQLELTGGLRYFEDRQVLAENISATLNPAAPLIRAESAFDALTPRTVLAWHPNDDLTFYASYAQGFRSGLQQQPSVLIVAPQFPPAEPDRLHNYELGTKGSLWDGRLRFDAAVFYLDWRDLQQSLAVDPTNPALVAVVNANTASGLGYEFGVTLAPLERLALTGSLSWNDLTFDGDVFSGGSVLFGKGDRLINSPEYTAGLSLDYSFPVGQGFELLTSLSGNYTSAIEFTQRVAGMPFPQGDGESILMSRVSVMLSAPERWSLTLFVDNVGDERDPTTRGLAPATWYALNTRPRTFGLQVEFRM